MKPLPLFKNYKIFKERNNKLFIYKLILIIINNYIIPYCNTIYILHIYNIISF